MALTHAEIVSRIQNKLSDTTPTYYSAAYVAEYMGAILKELSHMVPYRPLRSEYTTDGTTRDLTLTDWDYDDLVRIPQYDGVEYTVDQSPQEWRNSVLHGRALKLLLDDIPASSENVYLYPEKVHILQSAIGTTDTAGAVKTAAAAAATSLVLKSLGTGTINKYTKLTIAGDTTEYTVKAAAAITTNEATVTIHPALSAAASADAVVTLALNDGTLSPAMEEAFILWVCGSLITDYAIKLLPNVPSSADWKEYTAKGEAMITQAKRQLSAVMELKPYVVHPR